MQEYLICKSYFLCSACVQLGIELFITRLCMYVGICIICRSYNVQIIQCLSFGAGWCLVGNFELFTMFNFLLTWFTVICRPLSLNMFSLLVWTTGLPKTNAVFRSILSWGMDKDLRESNFFVFFLPNHSVPIHRLAQWYFPRSLFFWSLAVLFEIS